MRKRLILFLGIACCISMNSAIAFLDLLSNKKHQAYNKYMEKDYDTAYDKFADHAWKGIAALKNKQYELAIDNLVEDKTIRGQYNLGNAYAFNGELDNAINMYKEVLKQDPNHLDAKHNLSIVEKLKDQAKNQQNSSSNNKQKNKNQQKRSQDKNQHGNNKQSQDDNKQGENKQSKDKDKKDQNNQPSNKKDKQNKDDQEKNKQQKSNKNTEQNQQNPKNNSKYNEKNQADEQWLRTIQDDPGGLLKNKFLRDHMRRRKN